MCRLGYQPTFKPKFEDLTSKERAVKEFFGDDAMSKIPQNTESDSQTPRNVQKKDPSEVATSMRAKGILNSYQASKYTQK